MPSYVDIAGWIDSIATPHFPSSVSRGRKRPREIAEMDATATASTPKRIRTGKHIATSTSVTPATSIGIHSEHENAPPEEEVDDDTPRGPRTSSALPLLSKAPILNRPPSTPSSNSKRSYSEDDDSSSHRSGRSGDSKRSRRTGSSLKQSSDRQYALYPIRTAVADMENVSMLSKALQDLARPLKAISRDIAVLPRACDTPAMRKAVVVEDVGESVFRGDGAECAGNMSSAGDLGDTITPLEAVHELVRKAAHCKRDGAYESAWNCEVHYPLLEMARRCSRHADKVSWHNITNACIHPASLVPSLRDKEKVQSRKVDFGLSIQLSYLMKKRLAQYGQRGLQLNQTDYRPIMYDPLAISIETKLPDEGGSEARAQLLTWAEAQLRQLRILLQQAGHPNWQDLPIPPLPLLFVQGCDWTVWCFEDRGEDAVFYDQGIKFGRTTSVMGTYRVIAGLQVLMEWTMNVWWPWIREHILRRLFGECNDVGDMLCQSEVCVKHLCKRSIAETRADISIE